MPWSIVLLPLLGGFWFISLFYPTRYISLQVSRERLYFYSASAGLALAALSRVIALWFSLISPNVTVFLKTYFFPGNFTATAFIAAILGPAAAILLNRWMDADELNYIAIGKYGDLLERIVADTMETDGLLMFTLKSGKVYIGLATSAPANLQGPTKWMEVLPYFSGFREKETHDVQLTTSYVPVIYSFSDLDGTSEESEENRLPVSAFVRVIDIDQLESCAPWNEDVWNRFHSK